MAVIIVPVLLLLGFLLTLLSLCIVKYCPERRPTRIKTHQSYHSSTHRHTHTQRPSRRDHLRGIDGQQASIAANVSSRSAAECQTNSGCSTADVHRGHNRGFSQVTALPLHFSIDPDNKVGLYRARMENRDVILRVLKANSSEKQHFFGFASFVSGLGPHPFLPALLGVVSEPPMIVVEELQHRDLLGYLWRCRQSSCEMTEKRIFTMAGQVASALEYLHSQGCIHGNVGARSVLVGGDLTAKLWGLGSAHRRRTQANVGAGEDVEMKKWQAPEVLGRRAVSQSSDVWSFGILLYEMVTLGDPPFAQLMATELLQYLQRGKHLKRPTACSNSLYSLIRSCCRWNPQQRFSTSELIGTLQAGERSANGTNVIRVPEPMNIERYLREAGYGETHNYAVL
uniref:Protein kinase domain-containing protein n=1 Tax=Labrus bergylta TaxID=56723 RepID=A0A3Q3FJV5_9LABR